MIGGPLITNLGALNCVTPLEALSGELDLSEIVVDNDILTVKRLWIPTVKRNFLYQINITIDETSDPPLVVDTNSEK